MNRPSGNEARRTWRNAECGIRNAEWASERRFAFAFRLRRLLHPPLLGDQVFEQHHSPSTLEDHFQIPLLNRHAPPFVIDAPDFTDRFHAFSILRLFQGSDNGGPSLRIELNLHSLWDVEGSKPVRSIPHSFTVHNRSVRNGARECATMAEPR